jgi:hypothetical protein
MVEEIQKWGYRVQTVGSFWSGVKADELEQHVKRLLSSTTRRFSSMPLQS